MSDNGWHEYQKLILAELARHDEQQKMILKTLNKIQIEIATLKVKAGLWGAGASLLVAVAAYLIRH